MKKYLYVVADVLTLSRIFPCAVLMVIFTILGVHPSWALAVFVIGELTDAFDGPAAVKWKYPEALEKRLWWRVHKIAFDMTADMVLGATTLAYVAFRTYQFGMTLAIIVIVVGVPLHVFLVYWLKPRYPKVARTVMLARRRFAYVPMIAVVIIVLLLAATVGTETELTWKVIWQTKSFWIWVGIGVVLGAVVAVYKRDRLMQLIRGEKL